MTSASTLAVALIGKQGLAAHVAAIMQTPHLQLCAISPSAHHGPDDEPIPDAAGVPIISDPQELLGHGRADVLAICTAAQERSYWIQAGLAAQRWVVAPLSRSLPADGMEGAGRLCVEAPLACTALEQLAARTRAAGRIDYVRATMKIPARWLHGEGVLLRWGAWLPYVLQEAIGPIDLVQARTHSFRNGPSEDHALALISFCNGTEGHIEIDACSDQAEWQIEMNCDGGTIHCGGDLRLDRADGLGIIYENVGRLPKVSLSAARESLFLGNWIRQSARREISLSRREARRG